MADESPISLSSGLPETVLPDVPEEWAAQFSRALELPLDERRDAIADIAAHHPRYIAVWPALASLGRDPIESYAYARVGYHRGLDTLRGSGWHGTGYVRWRHPSNEGFSRRSTRFAATPARSARRTRRTAALCSYASLIPTGIEADLAHRETEAFSPSRRPPRRGSGVERLVDPSKGVLRAACLG